MPAPNAGVQLTNLAATKTGFTSNSNFKDFEFKKQNLLEIMSLANKEEIYKATTKGKFTEHVA